MRNYDYVPDRPNFDHPDVCGEDREPKEADEPVRSSANEEASQCNETDKRLGEWYNHDWHGIVPAQNIPPDAVESLADYHRELNRLQDARDAEEDFWHEQEVAQQEADNQ